MNERIPLIYVLSNGRSGSTLLDLLLGTSSSVWSVGEAQILPWEVREGRAPCGCGSPVEECAFWAPLLPELFREGEAVPVERFRDAHGTGRVLRPGLVGGLWWGRTAGRHQAAAKSYGEANQRYLARVGRAARELRGAPLAWLVDASKDPYRLLWLKDSHRFDLRVIHLTKDPRAFVWSMIRGDARPRPGRVLRFAARWLVENLLFHRLCRKGFRPEHVRRVRYEDLAQRPHEVLAALGDWLGVSFPPGAVEGFRSVENHAISGNRMRWLRDAVRLDEGWRSSFPADLARRVWRVTWPVRRRLGYARP